MTTGFTTAQKAIILERDGHKCPMCGKRATEANHRANRGHGGFMGANVLSNGCAICTECNGLIESHPTAAAVAIMRGVKISRYDDAKTTSYLHPILMMHVYLDDDGGLGLM